MVRHQSEWAGRSRFEVVTKCFFDVHAELLKLGVLFCHGHTLLLDLVFVREVLAHDVIKMKLSAPEVSHGQLVS